jgi:hypothetical protein
MLGLGTVRDGTNDALFTFFHEINESDDWIWICCTALAVHRASVACLESGYRKLNWGAGSSALNPPKVRLLHKSALVTKRARA